MIRSRSMYKRRNLWAGRCVFPLMTIVCYFIHIMYYNCIQGILKLLVGDLVLVLQLRTSLDVSAPGHSLCYWNEYATFGLFYFMLRFSILGYSTRDRAPGFATDYPCGVWCRGSITCLLYVGPLWGNLVWNDSGSSGFDIMGSNFSFF